MVIRREIEVKRKGLPRPIDVTYGTNLLDLEFVVIDFNIPTGAVVRAFAMGESQKVKSLPCNIQGNKIWFTPEAGLFDEGKNVLQFALEHEGKNLFTFYNPINCHYTMQFEGAQDLENDPAFVGMVMRMQQDIADLKKNGSGATKEQIEQIEKNKQNISELSEQIIDYIFPEMYGAVGDGVTDDSVAIQQAIDEAGATKIVYLANKTYAITTGLTIDTRYARFICDGTLLYSGMDSAITLNTSLIKAFINLIRAENGTGIKLNGGVSVCDVEIHSIRSSVIGCHLYGASNNITYNKIRIGQIYSSDIDIFIEKVSSYVNENYFWLSNIRGDSNCGIKIVGGGGNKFFSGGLEGISSEGCGIYIEDGEANEFHAIRCVENYGKNAIILKGTCSRNIFELSACELNDVDITGLTDGTNNYVSAPYLRAGGYSAGYRAEISAKFGKVYDPRYANIAFDVNTTNFPNNIIEQVDSQIPTTLRFNASENNEITYTLSQLYSEYDSCAKGFSVCLVFGSSSVGKCKLIDSRGGTILDNTSGDYANKTVVIRWNGYDKYGAKSIWDIQVFGDVSASIEYVKNYAQPKGNYLTNYTETDPTVPSWAKQSTKPEYTASEVGLGNVDNVKQYSKSNPPPYPVTSVNGKTGSVTINIPSYVNETWTFTLEDGSTVQKVVVLG